MTQPDDQSEREKYQRAYTESLEKSRRLLERIDELDVQIAAARNQKQLRGELERDNATIRRQFAEHLGQQAYVEPSSSRSVTPIWLVTGVPSKKHKEEAREWMRHRGLDWDGSAPPLRHEVRKALEQKQSLPEGKFGLHVERTIDIKSPRAFTINLLGKPHHVLASATGATKQDVKD